MIWTWCADRAAGVIAVLFAIAIFVASGCERQPTPEPKRLLVLAAASLADAFRELGKSYEASHPGVRVEFSFAGSNQLRAQLENGAEGDVFASADRRQMDAAAASDVVRQPEIRAFAMNTLAILVPKENKPGLKSLADLARPGLKVVVAADAVPAGGYTRRMLETAAGMPGLGPEFVAGFEANVASREQNVSAVVAKVALGEADAGIGYASDAMGGQGDRIAAIRLPKELDQPAEYVAAPTARTKQAAQARDFVSFVASREGAAILSRRGYIAPMAGPP